MRMKQRAALLLAVLFLLPLSASQAAGTLAADGKVKRGVYTNSAGITFTMPDKYDELFQKIRDEGFLRITLEPVAHKMPTFFLDIREGPIDLMAMGEAEYLAEIAAWPVRSTDRYTNLYLMAFHTEETDGVAVQQTLAAFWYYDIYDTHSFAYSSAWCTQTYYVRLSMFKIRADETMTESIAVFNKLRDSIFVP